MAAAIESRAAGAVLRGFGERRREDGVAGGVGAVDLECGGDRAVQTNRVGDGRTSRPVLCE